MSDLGGMGDMGGVGFDDGSSGAGNEAHLTVERRVSYALSGNRIEVVYQGPYNKLKEKLKDVQIGHQADKEDTSELPEGGSDTQGAAFGMPRYATAQLVRTAGGLGRLSIVIVQNVRLCAWQLDWAEVSKPILTWKADAVNEQDRPDLAKIAQWKAQGEDSQAFQALKIEDKALEGNTQKLAEMILKGIENYPRYAPTITCTLTVDAPPLISDYQIGKIITPEAPYGCASFGNKGVDTVLNSFTDHGRAVQWIITESRVSQNNEGGFLWVITWQACDAIEECLYEEENA